MRPWIKRTLFGVFGASLALGALTGCGHRLGHHGDWNNMSAEDQGRWRQHLVDRIAGRLDLDAAQKARLAALAEQLHQQHLALRGKSDPRADVQSLVAGDRFDRARAQGLLAEKTAALQAGSPALVAAFGDFYDGLSPAQQAKVREFMQRRRGGWRSHG
jgi:Spy/CpxP family protein refolding chaperone